MYFQIQAVLKVQLDNALFGLCFESFSHVFDRLIYIFIASISSNKVASQENQTSELIETQT